MSKRETHEQAGLRIVSALGIDVILEDETGKRELWTLSQHHAGYAVTINGREYEFVRTVGATVKRPCGCDVGLGKYEGESALTALMIADDAGDFLSFGDGSWAALDTAPSGPSDDAIREAAVIGFCDRHIAEAIIEMVQAPAITYGETSQGFAWSTAWDSARKAQEAFDADAAELADAEEENS